MTMYIRVKRQKQTIFLNTDPTETIASLKAKLASLNKVPAANLRLLSGEAVLDDAKSVGDSKIENDAVVFLVHKKEGSDAWEDVDVQKTDVKENK